MVVVGDDISYLRCLVANSCAARPLASKDSTVTRGVGAWTELGFVVGTEGTEGADDTGQSGFTSPPTWPAAAGWSSSDTSPPL